MYKLIKDPILNDTNIVVKITEGRIISIPFAEDNRHYQEYLQWVAEGNTPEPADEV